MKNGIQIGDYNSDYNGDERLLDGGPAPPSEVWHLQGDARVNSKPVSGGNMAWANVPIAITTLNANVVAGTTTSFAVSACPPATVVAGTPVIDQTGFYDGISHVSLDLGRFASCSGGTLTLQAAATNLGANGDTLQFMQWRAASPISNDPYGVVYHIGYTGGMGVVALMTSYPCDGNNIGSSIVNDGLSYVSAGYGVALTTGGGPATRPVFCDGTSWTYH